MATEMNRDESDRCIQIAQRSIEAGDLEKAVRFLEKSIKLFPTSRAQDLLDEVAQLRQERQDRPDDNQENNPDEPSPEQPSRSRSSSHPRQRRKPPASPEFAESRPGSDTHKEYTDEQNQAVIRVKKCTTFYEVLQVEKTNFSEAVLKKQYRKLALVLHPDKNKAPHAGEAFKIVGKAYAVLSNPQKKVDYDTHGENYETTRYEQSSARRTGRRRYYRSGNFMFYEDDVSADDIFNMFFGTGFQRFNQEADDDRADYSRQGNAGGGQQRQTSIVTLLLQLSPLLLFLGLSALSSWTYTEPMFSLHQSVKYPNPKNTRDLGVRFYYKDDLDKLTSKDWYNIERNVEEVYMSNLKENCMRERAYKENVIWRGKLYGDVKLINKGKDLTTPSCDNLASAYEKLAHAA
ncbi:dnaJ homolog subfamily B member 12-like [Paramacrobiotus metropolitanus]|uniref:dnaJ homolog subfamily B member 12-like n=1 Tax=Paramacrobiotus metropolitanus TaxID=2943436 RepID=UPI0024464DE4|nr:dnaJ homolog subfamily B member 12-like [Paramacrobiotus metropolitanus]